MQWHDVPELPTRVDLRDPTYKRNRDAHRALVQDLRGRLDRATLTAYFLASGIVAMGLLLAGGQLDREIARLSVLAAPALLGGFVVGHVLFHRIDEVRFRQVVIGVLLLSALLVLVGSLAV